MNINIPSLIISHPQINTGSVNLSYRNILNNPYFYFSQRGRNFSGMYGYFADWWYWDGQCNIDIEDIPYGAENAVGNATHCLKISGASSYVNIRQRLQPIQLLAGGKATLSFYIKTETNTSGDIYFYFIQHFGVNDEVSTEIGTLRLNNFGSWRRYSFTFDVPSLMGHNLSGDEKYIEFRVSLPPATYYLTGFQLEKGEAATDLELRDPVLSQISLASRFEKGTFSQSFYVPNNFISARVMYRVVKRVIPRITISDFYIYRLSGADYLGVSDDTSNWSFRLTAGGYSYFVIECLRDSDSNGIYRLEFSYIADAEL